ncbi:MAG: relaxase/mobilization nuclease domain-containing protein [Firmicutes bacterium]|nr:relaxase/mobilization nuclease domain-containing protein [Bacillota bacterium]
MPLFKGSASKSTPDKAIRYITDKNKAAAKVSVRNLFEDEDYAKQFRDTANLFGKGSKHDERKYYHFKLSCAQKDNVSPEEAHIYAVELAARLFHDCECVVATHNDTKTIHSHIIVNAVHPITGKKLRITESDYTAMKDEANVLGAEMGFTPTDFRKKSKNKRTLEECHIILKGGNSWKEDLREVIEEAKQKSATREEFISHLKLYNVTVTRSITEYSFLHPEKQKPIRGKKLGENYSKEIINNAITENGHRRNGDTAIQAVTGITGAQYNAEGTVRYRPLKRSVGDIQRELQQFNRKAEYAHRGTDWDYRADSDANTEDGNKVGTDGRQGGRPDESGVPQSKPDKVGDKASRKERDYGLGK